MVYKLDKIDGNILQIIQGNAKITNLQLAETIGLSPASTLERVRKLETQGIITGYYAQVDRQKLSLNIHFLLQIRLRNLTSENVNLFTQAINALPEVVTCYQVIGEADFILNIITADFSNYQKFLSQQLSAIPAIKSIKTLTVLSTIKSTGLPIPVIG